MRWPRLRSVIWLVGTSVVLWACSRAKPPSSSSPNAVAGSRSAEADAAEAHPEERDPRLEARLDEYDRFRDWRSAVFGTRAPNPPIAARATKIPEHGRFPTNAVTSIRAYHYRHGLDPRGVQRGVGPRDVPFTADGRLDGRVILPEVLLTNEERDRVLALVRAAEERQRQADVDRSKTKEPVSRCVFENHHAFVFFDAAERPIAKLLLCFSCGELVASPGDRALGGGDPKILSDEERETFQAIFDGHGLGAWTYGNGAELHEVLDYEARVYGFWPTLTAAGRERRARREDRPSGVPLDLTPKSASREDSERFCIWLRAEMWSRQRRSGVGTKSVMGSFECSSGRVFRFGEDGTRPCDTPSLCDVPFGRMEACLRASFLKGPEDLCDHGLPGECDGLSKCLPFVDWRGG
jgi:hypothetical protein